MFHEQHLRKAAPQAALIFFKKFFKKILVKTIDNGKCLCYTDRGLKIQYKHRRMTR